MNKEQAQWVMIIVLLAGLVGIALMVFSQNAQIDRVSNSVSSIATDVRSLTAVQTEQGTQATQPSTISPVENSDGYQVVTVKSINWNGKNIAFTHKCKGEIKVADEQVIPYCIGDNKLVTQTMQGEYLLKGGVVSAPKEGLVFLDAKLVPSVNRESGFVLLSYVKDACYTMNDCGAGMDTNFVTLSYQLGDTGTPVKAISNYPGKGNPVWNPSGTKAVFIPDTCGGAGCDLAPLTGYNLLMDTAKTVTSVKAAWSEDGTVFNAGGDDLPLWINISWKSDTDFTSTIKKAGGTIQTVTGTL